MKRNRVPFHLVAVLLLVALFATGCGMLTGPNRFMRVLGPEATSDFATFEGSLSTRCEDVRAVIGVEAELDAGGSVVGCMMGVTPVGSEERYVFCPLGQMRDRCRLIPLAARVSINGRPLGDNLAYLPTSVSWAGE